mmetsp:Transcript_35468/g.57925  ORF Transcript_35468/g.57925 Transcript_35468/m.57925 type:complete len:129 (+) Transcript_35468:3-389(+)
MIKKKNTSINQETQLDHEATSILSRPSFKEQLRNAPLLFWDSYCTAVAVAALKPSYVVQGENINMASYFHNVGEALLFVLIVMCLLDTLKRPGSPQKGDDKQHSIPAGLRTSLEFLPQKVLHRNLVEN